MSFQVTINSPDDAVITSKVLAIYAETLGDQSVTVAEQEADSAMLEAEQQAGHAMLAVSRMRLTG